MSSSVIQDKSPHRDAKVSGGEEQLRAGQNRLLEMIARGAALEDTLSSLARFVESQHKGLYCSVLLLDEDGKTIRAGAGPHLPPLFMQALNGLQIGPDAGSCGAAMYRKELVIVADIDSDPLWQSYKQLVLPHGFRACWSRPILQDDGTVQGSFAMYYREAHAPSDEDLALLDVATHIASIAIERSRRELELQRHRFHLEELVEQRTQELQQAKERAEDAVRTVTATNQELAQALNTLRVAQDELVRSKKLIALGSLVAGIAHELNTPIGNSVTTASALHDQTESWKAQYEKSGHEIRRSSLENFLGKVGYASDLLIRNLERAANLIASFKQVAIDPGNVERRPFMLDQLVADVIAVQHAELGRLPIAISLIQQVEPGIAMDSYPKALNQVLTNLLENCVTHAFKDRDSGNVTITARKQADGDIEITVADDGVGIAAENQDRIFDPFFTTKFGSGGCGLGLNVVHNLLEGVLGGSIRCSSIPDQGTVFSISLPAVAP